MIRVPPLGVKELESSYWSQEMGLTGAGKADFLRSLKSDGVEAVKAISRCRTTSPLAAVLGS